MSFEPRDYLRHVLVEVDYLLDQSRTLTYECFAADETLRRAFVRSLEISSHHIFRRTDVEERINLQRQGNKAKPYQVRQVRAVILRYRLGEVSDV